MPKEQLIQTAEMIHDGQVRLHLLGDGRHAAHGRQRDEHRHLQSAAGHRQRRASGHWRLSAARPQQRAGRRRLGLSPAYLPGYEPCRRSGCAREVRTGLGRQAADEPGFDNHQMVDAIHEGKLKAMYWLGRTWRLSTPTPTHVQAAFEKLEFFVVQDVFFSKTAEFADVILPASPSLEKEGTFTNTERRIQRLYQALPPLGDSRPDWQIIRLSRIASVLAGTTHHPRKFSRKPAVSRN